MKYIQHNYKIEFPPRTQEIMSGSMEVRCEALRME